MKRNLYGGRDPRDLPAYTLTDAARYLGLPRSTLRDWTSEGGIIRPAEPRYLSFNNLIEGQALAALRRVHGLKLERIRTAIQYVARHMNLERPLLSGAFSTDGVDLFVERGELVSASRAGQLPLNEIIRLYLRRIDWDELKAPIRLYPLTRPVKSLEDQEVPRSILIDPTLAFGRPVLRGASIPTDVLAGRFQAGESPDEIAADYGVAVNDVLEAIRWEKKAA